MTKKYRFKLIKIAGAAALWMFALGLGLSAKAGGISKLEGEFLACPNKGVLRESLIDKIYKSFACEHDGIVEGPFLVYYPLAQGEKIPRRKQRGFMLPNRKFTGVFEEWFEDGYRKTRAEYDKEGVRLSELRWNEHGELVSNYQDGSEMIAYSKSATIEDSSKKTIRQKIYELMGGESAARVARPRLLDGANEVTK